MIRLLLLVFFLTAIAGAAVALIVSVLVLLAMAAAVILPLWLLWFLWNQNRGQPGSLRQTVGLSSQSRIDRLKALYVEGKIDIFEFEQRLAHLIAIEP